MKIENISDTPTFQSIVLKIEISSQEELDMINTFIGYTGHLTSEVKRHSKSFDSKMMENFLNGVYRAVNKGED